MAAKKNRVPRVPSVCQLQRTANAARPDPAGGSVRLEFRWMYLTKCRWASWLAGWLTAVVDKLKFQPPSLAHSLTHSRGAQCTVPRTDGRTEGRESEQANGHSPGRDISHEGTPPPLTPPRYPHSLSLPQPNRLDSTRLNSTISL